jgi:hypothetical protein
MDQVYSTSPKFKKRRQSGGEGVIMGHWTKKLPHFAGQQHNSQEIREIV